MSAKNTPTTTLQITWVYTNDLARSRQFYTEVLGLRLIKDEGSAFVCETAPGAAIGVCQAFEDRVVEPRGGMISLVSDDVDGWYERLTRMGANTLGAPHRLDRFAIYTFFAKDPDDYVIEFQQFL